MRLWGRDNSYKRNWIKNRGQLSSKLNNKKQNRKKLIKKLYIKSLDQPELTRLTLRIWKYDYSIERKKGKITKLKTK